MQFLHTLNGLLEHVKSVERETIALTQEAQLRFVRFLDKNGLSVDDETLEAMQYQDIIAQQLSATIEAIESAQEHMQYFIHAFSEDDAIAAQSIERMHGKLTNALEKAKEKHSAFSGKVNREDDDDGIEFF
ncbi:MAG: hypothetical protein M1300_03095 [Epsilonproteobacteria bacterium]|nr:hypothetical protein [Campylobacterota bacterium]